MQSQSLTRYGLTPVVLIALAFPAFGQATSDTGSNAELETVVVTGSLIPQTELETTAPLTTISARDLQERGFTSIADALQQSAFATGSVQGAQTVTGFTPGLKTLSLFGLSPSYVKYLIDGRPMADYPALYNGTDIVTSISGIPFEMVDHIDILPGGQSSIYGSDAIAGVVNIIMKKKLDTPVVDLRYGWYGQGGGDDRRITLADSFTLGNFNLVAGLEGAQTAPIWGYQRDLTKQYFTRGTSPQTAERDYLVFGAFGDPATGNNYYFPDPANCANVAGEFNGTGGLRTRPGHGTYCGTTNAGYNTVNNGEQSEQAYLHATFDLNPSVSFYGDLLASHDDTRFQTNLNYYSTSVLTASNPGGYYYDPNLGGGDLIQLQHIFSPEEAGGLNKNMSHSVTNAYTADAGVKGAVGTDWTYDVSVNYTRAKLAESLFNILTAPIEAYFNQILGPDLGPDPIFNFYPTYTPNYAAFFTPITPAQYSSFGTTSTSHSKTTDSLVRAQITDTSLFKVPAGDVALALVGEYGDQSWNYTPDPSYLNGGSYLYTSVAGGGDRSRYAATGELRAPIFKQLTFSVSGRYDDYRVSGNDVSKSTYNVGLEFRPLQSVLLRGRYGTAFKAPTLADEFQGASGYFLLIPDYYRCELAGISFANATSCNFYQNYPGQTSGSTQLKPISAKVYNVGLVFAPLQHLAISVDYFDWDISNEVAVTDADRLLRTEAQCRDGTQDITSPTCVSALALVTRDQAGNLVSFSTPKVNIAKEKLSAIVVNLNYGFQIGGLGDIRLAGQYNDMLRHRYQQFPGDAFINLLTNPFYSTEFKTRASASVSWDLGPVSSTVYANYVGRSPNNIAVLSGDYTTAGAGKLHPWTKMTLSVGYNLTKDLQLTGTVDNVFNKQPPLDVSYAGTDLVPYNQMNYDVFGRLFLVEASWRPGSVPKH